MDASVAPALVIARPEQGDDKIALSIVVPAYNEAFRLPALIEALRHHVDVAETEIIVVDDGSDDKTAAVAERAGDWSPHLVIIQHAENRGKGAAVQTGVAVARGDVIGFVDADNATDLGALGAMVAGVGGQVGAVFGSRHAPGSVVVGSPAIRGLMGRVFNHVVKAAAGTKIRDTQCGAKVFRGPAARLAFGTAQLEGFAFDVEVLRSLLAMGFDVSEYPVQWHYVHGSKITALTPVRMIRDIARIRFATPLAHLDYIDTEWTDELARSCDPLFDGDEPNIGSTVRLLQPGVHADAVQSRADEFTVATVGQSRTWLQLIGTSAS